jgi:hypothetical protein
MIEAISKIYSDIASNDNKNIIRSSSNARVGRIGISTASQATSSHPLILGWGGGPQLVNNSGQKMPQSIIRYCFFLTAELLK